MTKPRLSWTEAGRIAALADRCFDRPASAPKHASFTALRASLPPLPPAATPTAVAPATSTARQGRRVAAPDFRAVSPVIEERVAAFLAWTVADLSARAAFIADEGGLPLGNHGDFGDLAAVSTSVFHLLDEYQRELPAFEVGRVLLDMVRPNGVLHIVVVRTHLGRFGVGVLCDEAIDRAGLSALESGLTTTLTE